MNQENSSEKNAENNSAIPAEIQALSYEAARTELAQIVQKMESGQAGLEESIALWEKAEQLAAHCQNWLEGARKRLDAVIAKEQEN